MSKRLWGSSAEFVVLTGALALAEWALQVSDQWCWQVARSISAGPKPVYQDQSILVIALIQVAWQMGYDEVIDYLRAHAQVAELASQSLRSLLGNLRFAARRFTERRCSPSGFPSG